MNKYHIPSDLVLPDGENELHEKVNNDLNFRKYCQEMDQLLLESIADGTLQERISEATRLVYIFAEIAAFKEGFMEGIKFLISVSASSDEPAKSSERETNFSEALEKFLADYRMDRIADVDNFLEKDEEYRKAHLNKVEAEKALQEAVPGIASSTVALNYIDAVDDFIDMIKSIFYEHGFKDNSAISRVLRKGLNNMSLRTLFELDKEP